MKHKVVGFDWAENVDSVMTDMTEALKEFGLFVTEMETGADAFAYVISDKPLAEKEATQLYEAWAYGDDDDE